MFRRALLISAGLIAASGCASGGNKPPGTGGHTTSTAEGGGGSGAGTTGGSGNTGGLGGDGGGGTGGGSVVVDPADFAGADVSAVPVGKAPLGCDAFQTDSGELALTLDAEVPVLLLGAVGGVLQANGVACAGASIEKVKSVRITGTTAGETVIVDLATGPFGPALLTPDGGIGVDLGGGEDHVIVRGSYGADAIHAGMVGGDAAFDLDGDGKADTFVTGVAALTVSLGPGNDRFSAAGIGSSGAPLSMPITIFGDAGDDTLQGGAGDDTLHGGAGDDTFTSPKHDGADTYDGGDGFDTVDYSGRKPALTVTLDGQANDGEPGENDLLTTTIEGIIGGDGDDTLEGGPGDDTIRGGPGNDLIKGHGGDDSLYGDDGDDILEGGPGADMLDGGSGKNRLDAGDGDGDICIAGSSDIVIACELY